MLALRTLGKTCTSFVKYNGIVSTIPTRSFRSSSCVLNNTPIKPDFPIEEITPNIEPVISLSTANNKQALQHKIGVAVNKFQMHKSDTGSASVQIAAMTEKILSLTKHFQFHKKDKHGLRGFQMLLARRRKMLQYLMVKDIEEFAKVVQELGLTKEASGLRKR